MLQALQTLLNEGYEEQDIGKAEKLYQRLGRGFAGGGDERSLTFDTKRRGGMIMKNCESRSAAQAPMPMLGYTEADPTPASPFPSRIGYSRLVNEWTYVKKQLGEAIAMWHITTPLRTILITDCYSGKVS